MKEPTPMRVSLYSKDECHLCEAAREIILRVQKNHPFSFEEIHLTESSPLFTKYETLFPVILLNGKEISHWRISEEQLTDALMLAVEI